MDFQINLWFYHISQYKFWVNNHLCIQVQIFFPQTLIFYSVNTVFVTKVTFYHYQKLISWFCQCLFARDYQVDVCSRGMWWTVVMRMTPNHKWQCTSLFRRSSFSEFGLVRVIDVYSLLYILKQPCIQGNWKQAHPQTQRRPTPWRSLRKP